ncbi:MAG: right-handed parallel beta-helix repeat-containing protein, partial [Candidatus Micrarchaeia archaeon]
MKIEEMEDLMKQITTHLESSIPTFLVSFTIMFMLLSVSQVVAANCGGTIPCNCGDTVVSSYTMSSDLVCSGNGLIAGANDITIDCNGKSITGPVASPFSSFAGINTNGMSNVIVKNCIISKFRTGIKNRGDNNQIKSNNISNCVWGIWLDYPGDYTIVDSNTITTCLEGIRVYGPNYNQIINNNASGNIFSFMGPPSGTGITLGGGFNIVINNTFDKNGGYGGGRGMTIDGSPDNTIINNTFNGNKGVGIFATRTAIQNVLENNTANNNGGAGYGGIIGYGIYFGDMCWNNTLYGNTVTDNTVGGIFFDSTTSLNNISYTIACGNPTTDAVDQGTDNTWDHTSCSTSSGVTCECTCASPCRPGAGAPDMTPPVTTLSIGPV